MKAGFFEALQQAAAGIAPTPQAGPGPAPAMTSLHEQLLASVQAREGETRSTPSTYSVPTGAPLTRSGVVRGAQPAATVERSYLAGNKARQLRRGAGQSIEEALGEAPTPSVVDARVPAAVRAGGVAVPVDPRASDESVDRAVERPPVARWPHGKPLPRPCPVCAGKGFMEFGTQRVPCGRCGGSGEVPGVDLKKPYAVVETPSREEVEAALAREVDQPLPLEDPNDTSGSARVDVPVGVAGGDLDLRDGLADPELADAQGDLAAAVAADPEGDGEPGVAGGATGLTYDLPTDLLSLPAFCYVAGPAGTGKTMQAKAWQAANPEAVILAATTGIAAVNLGEGTTINALLRYYDTNSLTEAYTGGWLEGQLKRLRGTGLQRIVLDEVSMLSGDQLTILCRALDNVNADRGEAPELGLVLVGDFAQLAPVKEPFAFESAEWERFAQATYKLTTIRRQADQDFVQALQAIRRGEVDLALDFFGRRLEQTTHPSFEGTTILAKNEAVDKYNQLRLDKIQGAGLQFKSTRWGKIRTEWGAPPKPPREWGIPETLQLKVGALVMVLANRNLAPPNEAPQYLYVNGDLGTIVGEEKGSASVELQRTGEVVAVTPCVRDNLIPLEPGRRKALKEAGHPERVVNGKHEAIGGISYTPLRLAYASTVHKSQGLSLDRVQVNIRDSFFSQPGMIYVSLSRARTAEGLRLVGTEEGFRARIKTSPKVLPWL